MGCKVCGNPMTPQEIAAYRNRCEDCWSRDGGFVNRTRQGAESYSNGLIVENVEEVTNQVQSKGGSHRVWQGRRRDHS